MKKSRDNDCCFRDKKQRILSLLGFLKVETKTTTVHKKMNTIMKKLTLLCCLLGLMSCKKELEKPTNFISKDKMTDMLYDFAVLGGIENISAFYSDTTVSVIRANTILKKYKVDSLTFVENNRYYIELGDESYFKMQEEIMKRLEAKKEALNKIIKEEQEKEQRLEDEKKAKEIKDKTKDVKTEEKDLKTKGKDSAGAKKMMSKMVSKMNSDTIRKAVLKSQK